MSSPRRKVALSFMAHPDDAEILCGGTLARLRDLGWKIHITTATVGDCGSAELGPEEISEIRRSEGARAAACIGGTYHCLELKDVKVVYDQESVRRSIDLFRRVNPTLVFTHPRFDYMLDHEQVHLLARNAAFGFPIPHASKTPPPEQAAVPHLYYADPIEAKEPYTGELATYTAIVDVTAVMDLKIEMLACHASQREWLRHHHGMDEYIEAMKRFSWERDKQANCSYAEAFRQHLGHAYPQTDLLSELLT